MTALTVNGSAAAATTLAAAGKLFNATGGTSGNTSTKVGTSTQFKQIFATGTTTNQTGVASIPAPTDSNFSGWMWDVTTLEGQRLAAGTWTPTIHLLASTSTTVTPTVAWYKRSSGGVYTSIGSVAGSSIALTTSSQALTFTPPSLALMDFATGDKLVMWLWVNQTAGGATNSTISVVEATSGSSAGVASEAQTVTPGYSPIPVSLASTTLVGVGTLVGPLTAALALPTITLAGTGTLSETLSLSTALSNTLPGIGTLTETLTAALALPTTTLAGVGLLTETLSLGTTLTGSFAGSGTLTGTLSTVISGVSLTVECDGVGILMLPPAYVLRSFGSTFVTTGALSPTTILASTTLIGVGTLASPLTAALALPATTFVGTGLLTETLSLGTALSTTLPGIGTLSANSLLLAVTLAGEYGGRGILAAGTPSLATVLATTLAGVGTFTGTSSLATALSLVLAGSGTVSGTLVSTTALDALFPGVGTLVSTGSFTTSLACMLVGSGMLSGTLATSTNVVLAVTFAGNGILTGGALALTTTLVTTTSMAGSGTLTGGIWSLSTACAVTLVGSSTLTGIAIQLDTQLSTTPVVGTGMLASTLFLSMALTSTLAGIGTCSVMAPFFSLRVALFLLCAGSSTSTALMDALGTTVLSSYPIGNSSSKSGSSSSYGGKTVTPALPSGVYKVNGISLDSQPIVCTAPFESGSGLRFLVGSTFFLLFDRPTALTQSLLPDGGVVSMTFALASGNMVTVPQVQVASTLVVGVSIATLAVTCTLLSSLATPTLSLASSS